MKSNIAVSTSLSWNKNWNPYYSIDITKKLGIQNCQVYIGDNFNEELSRNLADTCSDEVNLVAHAPVDLNNEALNINLNKKITELLRNNKKMVVYHHDPDINVKDTIEVIKKINSLGITVLLENFYSKISDVTDTISHYIKLLRTSNEKGCMLYPLVDIPRLFIKGIDKYIDPLEETMQIFKTISELKLPSYLHMIDCLDYSQKRESWCSIGDGYIPYRYIFTSISSMNMNVPLAVLEFEKTEHIKNSVSYLREFNIFR